MKPRARLRLEAFEQSFKLFFGWRRIFAFW